MTDHPALGQAPGRMRHGASAHVVIIGGGASGVLMATHLLKRRDRMFRVTLIEGQNAIGHGLAYSTQDPDHLLNTRAHNMSAFPDDPDHFHRWLKTQQSQPPATPQCFVSRKVYGSYLSDLMAPWLTDPSPQRLRILNETAVKLQDTSRGVVVHVTGGQSIIADNAILATGHVLERPDPEGLLLNAWEDPGLIDPQERVVIIGSGLSMVDRVISLLKAGHLGEIVAISRRGLLPAQHEATSPLPVSLADVPFGAPLSVWMSWLRGLVRAAEQKGGTWHDAIDGIRPHVKAIWRGLPPVERARFLRHAATLWDVHRHRIPPASGTIIEQAMARGQLRLVRGRFLGASRQHDGSAYVRMRCAGSSESTEISAEGIFDCRGIRRDPGRHASPLIESILTTGAARIDPLNIGLDVDVTSRLINLAGQASDRLFAIGPASRAAFWEITAIPDIREQCERLASALALKVETQTRSGALPRRSRE